MGWTKLSIPLIGEYTTLATLLVSSGVDGDCALLVSGSTEVGIWRYFGEVSRWLPLYVDLDVIGLDGSTIVGAALVATLGAGATWTADGLQVVSAWYQSGNCASGRLWTAFAMTPLQGVDVSAEVTTSGTSGSSWWGVGLATGTVSGETDCVEAAGWEVDSSRGFTLLYWGQIDHSPSRTNVAIEGAAWPGVGSAKSSLVLERGHTTASRGAAHIRHLTTQDPQGASAGSIANTAFAGADANYLWGVHVEAQFATTPGMTMTVRRLAFAWRF